MSTRGTKFTTFFATDIDPGHESKIRRYESSVVRAYQNMENAAKRSSRLGGIGGNLGPSQQRLGQASAANSQKLRQQTTETDRLSASNARLKRALDTTAVALNVVQGPLGPLAGRVSAISNAISELTGVTLGFAAVGATLFATTRLANEYATIEGRLRSLYEEQTRVNAAFDQVKDIARSSRQDLANVADLYVRIASVAEDAGIAQEKTARIVELAGKAAALSGGTRQSQEAGLGQFAQAIGSGVLQGDELKSIRENTFALAQSIARGLGVGVGELKKLGAEGKLTSKVIADALIKDAANIEARFARLPVTLGQASTVFVDKLGIMIGEVDKATGLTSALGAALLFLGDNIQGVTALLLGFGAAFTTVKISKFTGEVATGIGNLISRQRELTRRTREIVATAEAHADAARNEATAVRTSIDAVNKKVAAARAEATAARQAVVASRARVASLAEEVRVSNGLAGTTRALRSAQIDLTNATSRLSTAGFVAKSAQNELKTAMVGLTQAEQRQVVSSLRLERVKALLASRMSFASRAALGLRNALAAVFSLTNILAFGVGILVTALIALATRKSEAAAAADKMAERESNLAAFIDFTTGKIIEQNKALIANQILKAQEDAQDAGRSYKKQRKGFIAEGSRGDQVFQNDNPDAPLFERIPGQDPRVRAVVAGYERGDYNISTATEKLQALVKKDPKLARNVNPLIRRAGDIVGTARNKVAADAAQRILEGNARPGDLELARGNFTGQPGLNASGSGLDGGTKGKATKGGGGGKDEQSAAEKAQERMIRAAERFGEKRRDILQTYSEESSAIAKARDQIDDLYRLADKKVMVDGVAFIGKTADEIKKIKEINPLGRGIYTQEMADNDAAAIEEGVMRPLRDLNDEMSLTSDRQQLLLGGYDLANNALTQTLELYRQIGEVPDDLLSRLIDQQIAEEDINDTLKARQKILDQYLGTADVFRDSLAEAIMNLNQGPKAIGNFFNAIFNEYKRQVATRLADKIFGGTDAKLRKNVREKTGTGLEQAEKILSDIIKRDAERRETQNKRIGRLTDSFGDEIAELTKDLGKLATAVQQTTNAIAPDPLDANQSGSGGGIGGITGGIASLINTVANGQGDIVNAVEETVEDPPIIVDGDPSHTKPSAGDTVPDVETAFKTAFEDLFAALDELLGVNFFKGMSEVFTAAFAGAGRGAIASGFAEALGIKQSGTGAKIGGAIGGIATAITGIPGLAEIGGLLGGTIGGMFKKAKTGSAGIGIDEFGNLQVGNVTGNSSSKKKVATDAANTVIGRIMQIAEALGGTIGSAPSVSIGVRDGNYRVDPTGQGRTKTKQGAIDFGDDLEAAIAFATVTAIKQGVISGISAASQRILQSGQDLQVAIEKAAIIESIPKRLLARTDPVRAAVEDLNREFTRMIAILKEAQATDQQFADAARLYALERAEAIEQATQRAGAAIQDFIDQIKGGSESPFSKRTTFLNAQEKLLAFEADILAGKAVDNDALLDAARNYEDASSELEGRGAEYFDNLNFLLNLLEMAKQNVAGSGAPLPTSPFEGDPQVQAAIDRANGVENAINTQTNTLDNTLQQILEAIQNGGGSSNPPPSEGSLIERIPTVYDYQ